MSCKKEAGGVICPTITMFNEDDTIDFEGTSKHLNWLIENGVHAILIMGTSGENATFTEEEYKKTVKFYVDEVAGRIPILCGVSSPATHISVNYAKYAEAAGVDGVFAGGPYYMRVTEEELIQFHKDVSASVDIPYLEYNNPGLSKLGLSVYQIANLTHEGVVSMVKDTAADPVRTMNMKFYCKEGTKVFFGDDYGAYLALVAGADGWTAGIANIVPKESVELWDTVMVKKDYEEGYKLWKKLLPLVNVTIDKGSYGKSGRADWLQMYKEGAHKRIGTSTKVRKPLFQLPKEDVDVLYKIMADLGY